MTGGDGAFPFYGLNVAGFSGDVKGDPERLRRFARGISLVMNSFLQSGQVTQESAWDFLIQHPDGINATGCAKILRVEGEMPQWGPGGVTNEHYFAQVTSYDVDAGTHADVTPVWLVQSMSDPLGNDGTSYYMAIYRGMLTICGLEMPVYETDDQIQVTSLTLAGSLSGGGSSGGPGGFYGFVDFTGAVAGTALAASGQVVTDYTVSGVYTPFRNSLEFDDCRNFVYLWAYYT